jgi:TRAP-type C4-dicarboxylate transport system permease small subunit
MYMDEYVFAGLLIIVLTCVFFVGVYRYILSDIKKHENDAH